MPFKRKKMLLLEVLLSMSVMTVLALMMMGNLTYFFMRGQKEKVEFAKEAEIQILDMMISKLFEEILKELPTAENREPPLYIKERDGKKNLVFFIFHSQDSDERFKGPLECDLSFAQESVTLRETNEKGIFRETVLLRAKKFIPEFFDPESKEWTDRWIAERDYLPPVVRLTVEREKTIEKLYYITPYLKSPMPI